MPELKSINPTDGSVLGSVKISTKADIEIVVKTARQGYSQWRQVPIQKRAQTLLKLSSLLKQQVKPLAELITKEMGKPITQSTDEILTTAADLLYNAKAGPKYLTAEILAKKNKLTSVLAYDPVGIVAAIKPWNYPINTPMLSIAPALVAGNSVIFKPSEYTSLVGKELAKLVWQAGIPKDVFQIIYGGSRIGAMLIDQPIDMVTFTGSSAVGKEIANKCAAKLIKFSLEMGGSTPAIVCRDADLELAAGLIVKSRFENCGQVCNAVKRVFVERAVASKLTNLIVKKTKALKVGNPMDPATDVGPLVSAKQLAAFENQITRGVVQGGRILTGGRRIREGKFMAGNFHQPTIMIHVQPRIDIMSEETFGPVLPICDVDNLDQAISYANFSPYGLTSAGFTKSKASAERIANEVVAGGCYINKDVAFYPGSPWTGLKDSGFGTAGGKHGLWEFTHKRHLHFEQV